ncbi:flavin reductase family protein [Citricoccus sp. K5]|uniref:flavin reductase family protein n=1 Tax=Citricoccus sp. K5 TaxID=2653135 RepID=UPI0012F332BA|nr:iron-sulfur cluster-binding domain-containing protein [Citricoccus sp. K5]VXB90666.1 Flavodoxin reductases (ferredoxin-NADPH reductases) family 1 [Citricoccus sp. K5]
MTVSTTLTTIPEVRRLRGLEMPWNRVVQASADLPFAAAATALAPWYPQEFLAECVQTIPEAGGMLTVVMRRTDGAPLAFRSGQYLNIAFPVNGPEAEPVNRSYSLSSAPTEPWTFAITVKHEEGGTVSPWIHENIRPGAVLEVLGPVGAFHLPDYDRRARYLFLAAGSGVTPLMSMIRTIHSLPANADVIMLYHGAAPGTFAFSHELEHLAAVDSRITVYYSLGDRSVPGTWEGMVGRLTAEMIETVVPDANGRKVFACGPEGYIDVAADLLTRVGVDETSIFIESFSGTRETVLEYREEVALAGGIAEGMAAAQAAAQDAAREAAGEVPADVVDPPTGALDLYRIAELNIPVDDGGAAASSRPVTSSPAAPEATGPADPATFEVVGEGSLTMSFLRTRLNVRIDPQANVLDAAREAGVRIGANCREGMCGSCKVVKVSGEVDMNHQGGIRAREIEAGKFLPCCSTAQTDLVVDA